jgi:Ca2+-binding EF-hand superfamily protein
LDHKEDISILFNFFDVDGDGTIEYHEFAYQFYNRRKVSERMKDINNINTDHHGHLRGSVAEADVAVSVATKMETKMATKMATKMETKMATKMETKMEPRCPQRD